MTRSTRRRPRAFTLLELIVVIAILAVTTAVATLALRPIERPNPNDPLRILADSQQVSLATGRAIDVRLIIDGHPVSAEVRPDGSIIADSSLAVDRLTGVARVRR